jgi:hypothetical protein
LTVVRVWFLVAIVSVDRAAVVAAAGDVIIGVGELNLE